MKTLFALLTATLAYAVVAGAATTNQDTGATAMLKAVVHVNFADPERREDVLENIENILKAGPTAQIEVVRHGKRINLVRSWHALCSQVTGLGELVAKH